jgi:hypothetical protein
MKQEDFADLEAFGLFLHEQAKHEESLKLEIFALRKTLEVYANPKTQNDPPLEETVKFLMDDPIVKSLVHRDFEEVARQIDDLIQEGKLKKLLYSMKPEGPVN